MENIIISYLLIVNIIAFITVYIDKQKAIKKQWRIKESTIIFIASIGGSIGTYIGMYFFRHKTRHLKFTLGIPLIILIQLSIFIFIKNRIG
ncbi:MULTISPECIES: DUF1294 domain-containing protein [Clostridium]|uniref:DUF1294 domain-containing protein n=1 Tax=Clostridium TaxID=1485 RepID=UPI0018991DDC|nr:MULTISPECIES: DUF1294 domain-containing protein [Clostridium]MCR1949585.1 DUF1294 domain-containing protein [Clostridium sp. DSM 100503]MDI9216278.1 DUF1294 domain-containing protein [Clostridium tertium]